MKQNDTIMASCTPHGMSALAMVRVSGPQTLAIVNKIWKGVDLSKVPSHTAHLGYIIDPKRAETPLDQCVSTVYRTPKTFTGEDMVEFSVHGSPYIVRELLRLLGEAGARAAGPGEFSLRAVEAGRMSLPQAEAAAALTAATSRAAHRMAMTQMNGAVADTLKRLKDDLLHLVSLLELELDFSEEDVEFASRTDLLDLANNIHSHLCRLRDSYSTGNAIAEGIPVAIVGATNAGKSSVLNALLGTDRAIVSDIHGTTRDVVDATTEIGDYRFRFMDTAGLRQSDDPIEQIGMERSLEAAQKAVIILHVIDATRQNETDLPFRPNANATILNLYNKSDLIDRYKPDTTYISAKTGKGISELRYQLEAIANQREQEAGTLLLTCERHRQCIEEALPPLERAIESIKGTSPILTPDLLATEVRTAANALSALLGEALLTQAVLKNIFSHFCVGK